MEPTDDSVLLRQYAENHSDEAFAALVARHVNLVYSVALRCVSDPHQAEEVAQAVFILLAKKAGQLRHDKALSSWLFQATRLTASNFIRGETRRHRREQEAHMQSVLNDPGNDVWPRIAPLLDDAVAGLNEKDRDAIVLRFYEGRNLREVGALLGASEAAAEKRVSRAVERLREFLAKRGVTVGASGLVVVMSANAVQAAPTVLAKTATAVAIGKSATVSVSTLTLIQGALKVVARTKAKTAMVASAVVLVMVGVTFEVKRARADEKAEENADDSWRRAGLTWQQVGQTAPQVKILPTKFKPPVYHMLTSDGIKRGGINVSVREILWAAYRCGPGRMAFTAGEPQEKYDFISTLRQGTEEALQGEVKKTLGLTGRWGNLETNILALKVRTPDAPGLKPAVWSPSESGNLSGGHIHCFGEALSWKPGTPPWGLTKQLERIFQIPIVDETGLTGSYNLDLRWKVKTDPNANEEAIKQALIEQLGLELVPVHKPVEMLIVEKVQ